MILQAFEYEKSKNEPNKLQEFFDSTKGLLLLLFNVITGNHKMYQHTFNFNLSELLKTT